MINPGGTPPIMSNNGDEPTFPGPLDIRKLKSGTNPDDGPAK